MGLFLSILSILFKLISVFVSQAYGEGSGADCRRHVQKLNLLQGQISDMSLRSDSLREAWLSGPVFISSGWWEYMMEKSLRFPCLTTWQLSHEHQIPAHSAPLGGPGHTGTVTGTYEEDQGTVPVQGVAGHSRAGYLSHGRLVLLHQLVHVLLILLQPVLDLIFLTLKAAQLLLQLDRAKTDREHQAWRY